MRKRISTNFINIAKAVRNSEEKCTDALLFEAAVKATCRSDTLTKHNSELVVGGGNKDHLTVDDAACRLGVAKPIVEHLLKVGILKSSPSTNSNKGKSNFVNIKDVKRLFYRLYLNHCTFGTDQYDPGNITFSETCKLLTNCGYTIARIVRLIISGRLNACAIGKKQGLDCFLFDKLQVYQLVGFGMDRFPEINTPAQAALRLEIPYQAIVQVVNRGFLTTKRLTGGKYKYAITLESIGKFSITYQFGFQYATDRGIPTKYANFLLKKLKIQPVSGPSIDGGTYNLYLRQDLNQVQKRIMELSLLDIEALSKKLKES